MPAGLVYFGMTLQGQGLCSQTIAPPTPPFALMQTHWNPGSNQQSGHLEVKLGQ